MTNNDRRPRAVAGAWQTALLVGLLVLTGNPATADSSVDEPPANPRDPWESVNRKIFVFNDTLDFYLLAPLARGYRWVAPDPVETGIGNFFNNLGEFTNIVNALLQAKFGQAGNDTGRLLVNSTVGVLGLFDVASKWGLPASNEDFGQTLAVWGVDSGPYIMVPFFGPYTIRSGAGAITEAFTTDALGYVDHVPTRNTLWGSRIVSERAALIPADDLVTGDRYTFIRDAYLQRRDYLANDGVVEDDFGDEDSDFDDWDAEETPAEEGGSATEDDWE